MSITTADNVKLYMGITGNTYDTLIAMLIPKVEADFLAIRNRVFDVLVTGEDVGVGDGTETEFTLAYKPLISDSEIMYLAGAVVSSNDYAIDYQTGVIAFVTAPDADVRITADYESQERIYPANSEMIAIQMVAYLIEKRKSTGVKSESLGDHSISFSDGGVLGYPQEIIGGIKKFVEVI